MPAHSHVGLQLCEACPIRRIGTDREIDLQPDNGAIATFRLGRGQVLGTEQLEGRFILVQKGSLKVEYLNSDGRPEVAAFLVAGDPVISTFSAYPVAITALEETRLFDLDPEKVRCSRERAGAVLRRLWHAIGAQAASEQRRLILARTGAIEQRIHWFLSDMAQRQDRGTVHLNMSRADIAHYLETSAESVSRAISTLARKGAIVREKPRRIRVVERQSDCPLRPAARWGGEGHAGDRPRP